MARRLNWAILSLGCAALLPFAQAQEVPSTQDITFTHPVLKTAQVSAPFGMRKNPFTQKPSWHGGVDLGAPWNDPIFAPAKGEVIFADSKAGWGIRVDLKLSDGWVLRFAHLKEISVAEGDLVAPGSIVGIVGATGRSTGPHLHLEAVYDGKQYDPRAIHTLDLYTDERTR